MDTILTFADNLVPQLLDENEALHFSLRRLQMIELIRTANEVPDGMKTGEYMKAVDFSTAYLAAPAAANDALLLDLEQTMVMLMFPRGKIPKELLYQLDPSFRRDHAKRVNEALLDSQLRRTKATLYDLVNTRAWAQQKGVETKRIGPEDRLSLNFDKAQNGHANGNNGVSQQNGGGDAMATGWEAE